MGETTLRDATPQDAEQIAAVARASWRDTYRDIFEEPFIERFLTENYSIPALGEAARRAAATDGSVFLVAERDGQVVAYLQFGRGPRGPELTRLYAHPDSYGAGAGSALLAELHRRIEGTVDRYLLDVHSRNARGRAFYNRKGFVIVGGGATPDCDLTLQRTLAPTRVSQPIETDRLRLRAWTDADAAPLHLIYGDAETMRYVGRSGQPMPDLDATSRVLRSLRRHDEWHGFTVWAVEERVSGELVGVTGLSYVEEIGPEVEVAYVLRRDRWGRGYASEAAAAALRAGFEAVELERIVALAYPENVASQRVMEKIGMRPDGRVTAYGRELVRYAAEEAATRGRG